MKSHHRTFVKTAEQAGMDNVRLIHNGRRHPVIAGTVAGRRREIFVGCSNPSDFRSIPNTKARIRRLIRQRRGASA